MKLLIDIDEEIYEAYKGRPPMLGDEGMDMIAQAISKGTPVYDHERLKGEWIPVSERLPEEEQDVLVCLTYKDTTHFAVTRLLNNKLWLLFSQVEVIAWMPLPEPYKKGDTE